MKNLIRLFCIALLGQIVLAQPLMAQGKIENFTLTDVIKNQAFSLADYAGEKCVVLIFTSNYCPYAKLYEERILKIDKKYAAEGAKLILVNSNNTDDYPDDAIEQMVKRAGDKKYNFPYLADKEQALASKLGVVKNPEAFVLMPLAGAFVIKYHGAIDNNPQVEDDATEHYLKDAISAVLAHKNVPLSEKKPTGCVIKKD